MTMHMIQGVQVHGNSKKKRRKLTQKKLAEMEVSWRQHNKAMRRSNCHNLQYKTFEEYQAYVFGETKPKNKKEFKPYVPEESYQRKSPNYPSAPISKAAGSIPDSGRKREPQQYTGDLIVGIGQMHKSNAVPVMRGTEQAKDIARMRR